MLHSHTVHLPLGSLLIRAPCVAQVATPFPGAHFVLASGMVLLAFGVSLRTFTAHAAEAAAFL